MILTQKEKEYKRAYADWMASLSKKEKAKMKDMNLDSPLIENQQASYTSACVSEMVDIAEPEQAQESETQAMQDQAMVIASDVLRRVIAEVGSSPNVAMSFDCLKLVLNLDLQPPTETEIAKRHKVTRACVSKRVVTFLDIFGLNPINGMKKKSSRETYSQTQFKINQRKNERN